MSLVIGILALQGDVREHIAAVEALGGEALPVRRAGELASVDALILPGGESTTIWRLMRAFDLLEPLRERVSEGMPTYGSCAGMILLADRVVDAVAGQETIGGLDVTVRRNAFGRQVDSFESALSIPVLGDQPVHAVFIRAPWVEEVGATVEILGSVEFGGANHPVVVRQGHLLATSFHPELTGDLRIHKYFIDQVATALR
ncbi:MAG TPA: pyridoxal 5'-phosphate synthase glutaminase subunit PdxT [Candidatus Nanopelagicaceae bacterium]|nr:pyridoxal 5'-phosphate synthase glutaminase subunit PdxT [Candidatus Nanopelagicaceae bacterium]